MKTAANKKSTGLTILLAIGLVTVVFPLYMTIVIALKDPSEMTNQIGSLLSLPGKLDFHNFAEAIRTTDFFHTLANSFLITAGAVAGVVLLNSIAAYAIGRNMEKSRYFKWIYAYFICGMFVPFSMLMLPLVKEVSVFGLDNRLGLILLYIVFNMPMNTLLYTGYLKNIPEALEEAACIDGAGHWRVYWKVVFPMLKPMHATVAIMTALSTWNDVMMPLVILSGGDSKSTTLPLAQLLFQSSFGTNYNVAFASYLLALLPILIFYLFAQRSIINGVTNGAVK